MDSYAKVGRGGAGNYYSPRDVQDAAEKLKEDVEAQQNNAAARLVDPDASKPEFAHAGRGGAGNFKPTATAAAQGSGELSTSIKQNTIPEGGYLGRGGVGNFRGDAEQSRSEAMAKAVREQEKAYEETVRDVEQGLRPPEKAHVAGEKIGEQ